jgi:CheY-like chemotaxis protein
LVDDEELVLRSIEKLLKREGYEVVAVRGGQEAIKQVQEGDYHLLVTDIRMPNINGIDTIQRIREVLQSKGKPRIPEICITGYADNELNRKAEALGVADYLYKPFDLRDFLDCIKRNIKN